MPAVEKRTISLPPAQAHYIDALVETGTYASASEMGACGPARTARTRCRRRALAGRKKSSRSMTPCRRTRAGASPLIR